MEIKIFKVDKYRGCPIYYRNMGNVFEYLAVIRKELYTHQIEVSPKFWRKVLHGLTLIKSAYSDQELADIIKFLKRVAETTVDFKFKAQTI